MGSILYFLLSKVQNENEFIYVPYFLVFILALIFSTSSVTQLIHLDEVVHVGAAEYYQKHWIPPEICSPEIIFSVKKHYINKQAFPNRLIHEY